MNKTIFYLLLALLLLLTACDQADVSSRNLSVAADNFEIDRRIVFYNGITEGCMLEMTSYVISKGMLLHLLRLIVINPERNQIFSRELYSYRMDHSQVEPAMIQECIDLNGKLHERNLT